jgi:hypothetical protein
MAGGGGGGEEEGIGVTGKRERRVYIKLWGWRRHVDELSIFITTRTRTRPRSADRAPSSVAS